MQGEVGLMGLPLRTRDCMQALRTILLKCELMKEAAS